MIPWIAEELVWPLKVRRAQGQPPYIQVAGGNAYGLYNADAITPHKPIVFCEGEFDSLLMQQEVGDLAAAVSLASVTASLNAYWQERLNASAAIYITYDRDTAGQRGAQQLLQSLPHAPRQYSSWQRHHRLLSEWRRRSCMGEELLINVHIGKQQWHIHLLKPWTSNVYSDVSFYPTH